MLGLAGMLSIYFQTMMLKLYHNLLDLLLSNLTNQMMELERIKYLVGTKLEKLFGHLNAVTYSIVVVCTL